MSPWVALLSLAAFLALSNGQFDIGHCHFELIERIYNTSVTLDYLLEQGDYTVLITSGLVKYDGHVTCAKIGYKFNTAYNTPVFFTAVDIDNEETYKEYVIRERKKGKMGIDLNIYDESNQYIVYVNDNLLLFYWCRDENIPSNDNYNNIVWLIAAKTEVAGSRETEMAVLNMLYHQDYSKLLNRRTLVEHPGKKFIELRAC